MQKRISINDAIEQSGLKKNYIAREIGVSPGYFAEFISRPDNMTIKQVTIFCKLVGKTIDEIDWNC
ncbi:helix-turn-helix domain-containing protein [Thomasclavelia spiroformis]|uniref:helix-turn-helix domain-containing protein n=1 Tax=Thomasclavelia spiroformis TaxID=29348 RepID=UPI0026DB1896|nr:helix-turn-helix transcriptional regulator [Thomasclavelia spiroformis]